MLEKSYSLEKLRLLSSVLERFLYRYSAYVMQLDNAEVADDSLLSSSAQTRILSQLQALRPPISASVNPQAPAKYRIKSLQEQLQRRRAIFEEHVVTLQPCNLHKSTLEKYYGDAAGWFKCPKPNCYAFSEGFASAAVRDQHHKKHERTYRCPFSGCVYATLGFTKLNELKRHQSNTHPASHQEFEFPTAPAGAIPSTDSAREPLDDDNGFNFDPFPTLENGEIVTE